MGKRPPIEKALRRIMEVSKEGEVRKPNEARCNI